jgi:hypothetical protein
MAEEGSRKGASPLYVDGFVLSSPGGEASGERYWSLLECHRGRG